jgi:ribonuclease P protein component
MVTGPRMAVIANRKVGSAVSRNHARRILREASRVLLRELQDNWDLLLVARAVVLDEPYSVRLQTLTELFCRAGVLREKAIVSP